MYLGRKQGRYSAQEQPYVEAHSTLQVEEVPSISEVLTPVVTAMAKQTVAVASAVARQVGNLASKIKPVTVKSPVPIIITQKRDTPYIVEVDAPVVQAVTQAVDSPSPEAAQVLDEVPAAWVDMVRSEDAQKLKQF